MYKRMLDKEIVPTESEMAAFCGERAELFTSLNEWLAKNWGTVPQTVFPYGKQYGWGIAHKNKKKLVCNIFAEDNAFTVMLRLTNEQFVSVYPQVQKYTQDYIENKYPCGDGGWIHYRVTHKEHFDDIQILLTVKCTAL